jgi:hypothetical protein
VTDADDVDVLPGNARSTATRAATEGALAGRNEVWSEDPAPARLGAKAAMNAASAIQATTITNRNR